MLDECTGYCALSYTWGQAEHEWAQDKLGADVEEDRAPEDESTGQPEIAQDDLKSDNEAPSKELGDEDAGLEGTEAGEIQPQTKADDTDDVSDRSGDDGSVSGEGLRDSCRPIIINDMRLVVTPNLYDALCFIRRSKLSRHYFWIDAICIDQQHVDERSAQVMLMGGIYERADKVIIWLGKENASSGRVLRMVSRLAHSWTELQAEFGLPRNANAEAFRPFRDPYGYENPVVLRRLGLEDTKKSDWLDLFLFLQRRWFQRQWILQEVVLSREVEMFWGSYWVQFEHIVKCANLLQATSLAVGLPQLAAPLGFKCWGIMAVPVAFSIQSIRSLIYEPIDVWLDTDLQAYSSVMHGVFDPHGNPAILLDLFIFNATAHTSTDPRDKIYIY